MQITLFLTSFLVYLFPIQFVALTLRCSYNSSKLTSSLVAVLLPLNSRTLCSIDATSALSSIFGIPELLSRMPNLVEARCASVVRMTLLMICVDVLIGKPSKEEDKPGVRYRIRNHLGAPLILWKEVFMATAVLSLRALKSRPRVVLVVDCRDNCNIAETLDSKSCNRGGHFLGLCNPRSSRKCRRRFTVRVLWLRRDDEGKYVRG